MPAWVSPTEAFFPGARSASKGEGPLLALRALGSRGARSMSNDEIKATETVSVSSAAIQEPLAASSAVDSENLAFGEYVLMQQIGVGGMGVVWRAMHRDLHRLEAIKMIRGGQASGVALERFRFEAEAAANLDHPNIVPVYGVGVANEQPFIAMKYVEGGSLVERLPSLQVEPRRIAALMAKLARAVHYAHQRGILHRDLKPGNILIDAADEPHITDFGLAMRLENYSDEQISRNIIGTPAYMAPEQALGAKILTTGADIYALGAILFELLTGKPPFTAKNLTELLMMVIEKPAPRPSTLAASVDSALEAVCLHCLAKSAGDRYPTALALAEDLERYLNGEPVSVQQPGIWDWLWFELRRNPAVSPRYTWPALDWTGAIILTVHAAIFGIIRSSLSTVWIWSTCVVGWVALCLVVWYFLARRFRELPSYERQKMMVAIGYLIAHVVLFFSYGPLSVHAPASKMLDWYVPALLGAGLCFFFIGTIHWGRFFLVGLIVMTLTVPMSAYPQWSPLIYGSTVALCLWAWSYALRSYFSGKPEGNLSVPK